MRGVALLVLAACGDVGSPLVDARPDGASDAPQLPAGLVAWYEAETPADGTVADTTGDHNGSCAFGSCPALASDGKAGHAYLFDGANDIITVASSAALETTAGFTVAAWFSYTLPPAGDTSKTISCFLNKLLGAANENSWQACVRTDNRRMFFYSSNNASASTEPITDGWHHVALWWNGSGMEKRTYLDGAMVTMDTGVTVAFDPHAMTIGADIDANAPLAYFQGLLDDIRVYNRALSDAEITALAQR